MFIAFHKLGPIKSCHIDRFFMDGTGRTHTLFEKSLVGPVSLHYDADLHRIFVADASTGAIETTSVEGKLIVTHVPDFKAIYNFCRRRQTQF